MIADMAIASCEFMFEETRNYVLQRKAFGKTIAHLQVCATRFFSVLTQNFRFRFSYSATVLDFFFTHTQHTTQN